MGQGRIEIDRLGVCKDDKEEKGAGQDKNKQIKCLKSKLGRKIRENILKIKY